MARNKGKKERKKFLAVLLLILSLIMITGILYALLSDRGGVAFNRNANKLKLNKNYEAKMRYYIVDDIEQSEPFANTISNLKPNNIIDVRIQCYKSW